MIADRHDALFSKNQHFVLDKQSERRTFAILYLLSRMKMSEKWWLTLDQYFWLDNWWDCYKIWNDIRVTTVPDVTQDTVTISLSDLPCPPVLRATALLSLALLLPGSGPGSPHIPTVRCRCVYARSHLLCEGKIFSCVLTPNIFMFPPSCLEVT